MFETSNPEQIKDQIYEHNWEYFTRNSLTTFGIILYAMYVVPLWYQLSQALRQKRNNHSLRVRQKVQAISFFILAVLLLRLCMIWSQNYFWYMEK